MSEVTDSAEAAFREFARTAEPRLRYALVAGHGAERGAEALNDALLHGWRHWERVRAMDNPLGYLYRVGQSKARRRRRDPRPTPVLPEDRPPWVEPRLSSLLADLSRRQREVVVLVEALQCTHREAAEILGISESSVRTHLERALDRLRRGLGVDRDA